MFSALTAPDTLELKGARPIFLRATQRFELGPHPEFEGERKVVTAQYVYTVAEDPSLHAELFSWQWHPGAWSEPHLHIGRHHPELGALSKLHVPTGRVAFEQVLRFLVTDFGVDCAKGRDEAMSVLEESLRKFQAFRTWS
jgi:hypothetical protein